jgi:DNA-binding transcriptional MocR family regulator
MLRNGWSNAGGQPARALLDAAERNGASFLSGEAFFVQNGGEHNVRLALPPVPRDALAEGIRRIGEVGTR